MADHRASLEKADFLESVLFWQTASILVRVTKPKKFRLLTYNNSSALRIYHSKAFYYFLAALSVTAASGVEEIAHATYTLRETKTIGDINLNRHQL